MRFYYLLNDLAAAMYTLTILSEPAAGGIFYDVTLQNTVKTVFFDGFLKGF